MRKAFLPDFNLSRGGFTLVELLVSISIFVILLTIAVGAIDLSSGNRGLSSGANQLQSAIEGARSRAAKLQRNVGLRFSLNDRVANDDSSTEIANTSFIEYVAAPEPIICRVEIRDADPLDSILEVTLGSPFNSGTILAEMVNKGIFTRGVKIQLYEADPNNPIVANTDLGDYRFTENSDPSANSFRIAAPLRINDTIIRVPNLPAPNNVIRLFGKISFESLIPLPNEQPIQLSKDVVIDWKSSKAPREWNMIKNNTPWVANRRYNVGDWVYEDNRYFKCIDFGTSHNSTEPAWAGVADYRVVKDNTVYWQAFPQPTFDLVFNPRGDIAGSLASNGVIHFVLASKDDVLKGRSFFGGTTDTDSDGLLNFEKEHRILTMFTQTGYTSISPPFLQDLVNNTTKAAPPDGNADDPYRFALEGVEAK